MVQMARRPHPQHPASKSSPLNPKPEGPRSTSATTVPSTSSGSSSSTPSASRTLKPAQPLQHTAQAATPPRRRHHPLPLQTPPSPPPPTTYRHRTQHHTCRHHHQQPGTHHQLGLKQNPPQTSANNGRHLCRAAPSGNHPSRNVSATSSRLSTNVSATNGHHHTSHPGYRSTTASAFQPIAIASKRAPATVVITHVQTGIHIHQAHPVALTHQPTGAATSAASAFSITAIATPPPTRKSSRTPIVITSYVHS